MGFHQPPVKYEPGPKPQAAMKSFEVDEGLLTQAQILLITIPGNFKVSLLI